MKVSDAILLVGLMGLLALVFMAGIGLLLYRLTTRTVAHVTRALSQGVTDLVNPTHPVEEVPQSTVQDAVATEALRPPWELWGADAETNMLDDEDQTIDTRGGPF